MTTKREQDLLEANHRLLMRARAAEETLTQAPEEAKKHLEAIRLITMLKDATGVLIHAAGQPGKNLEYEINSLLSSLAGKFERFIGLPQSEEEARSMVSVGLFYLNGNKPEYDEDEELVTIPRSEITLAEREAFKAGWRTNLSDGAETAENAAQLCDNEQTDFEAYQGLGLQAYLSEVGPIKAEFGTQEDPKTWADRWASKVDALAQQPADTAIIVQVRGLDQLTKTDPINEPRTTTVIDSLDMVLSSDKPLAFIGDELGMTHLNVGPVKIDLVTGKVTMSEDTYSDVASRLFWNAVEAHILHTRKPPRRVKHLKRGTCYEVIGIAKGQISTPEVVKNVYGEMVDNARILVEGDMLTIYRAEEDGKLYWRVPEEFEDGRFEDIQG